MKQASMNQYWLREDLRQVDLFWGDENS